MNKIYTQIGVQLSLYSGKTRSYLLHKQIPFVERGTSPWELYWTIKNKTNNIGLPIIITPEGEYLQDSSEIIDILEQRFPNNSILPDPQQSPILFFLSYAFELWGDEFWLPLAMHTRWSHSENRRLFINDAGEALLAGFPNFLKKFVGEQMAKKFNGLIPALGVNDLQRPLLDKFLKVHLDALNDHFSQYLFLFGGKPSLGDFGLIGPLYAHIGRDPWSKRELVDPRPHLQAWINRMFDPQSVKGNFFQDNEIPTTLNLALSSIFNEMVPFLRACIEEVCKDPACTASVNPKRFLSTIRFPFAGGTLERAALSYPIWMLQRLMQAFKAMPSTSQQQVIDWLQQHGGESLLQLNPPQMKRAGLSAIRVN